jgi:hypothetical protein
LAGDLLGDGSGGRRSLMLALNPEKTESVDPSFSSFERIAKDLDKDQEKKC